MAYVVYAHCSSPWCVDTIWSSLDVQGYQVNGSVPFIYYSDHDRHHEFVLQGYQVNGSTSMVEYTLMALVLRSHSSCMVFHP